MESMRDVDRVMEREVAKGSCPLRFVKIDFSDSPYQEIASREKLLEVLSYLLRTGDYGRFAGKGTGNNVYMDMKGKKQLSSVPVLLLTGITYFPQSAGMGRK